MNGNANGIIFTEKKTDFSEGGSDNLLTTTKNLIKNYQKVLATLRPKGGEATIHVDEIASKIAFFYERIRKIIDWKEEHLIRRGAIERVLKRRLISEISSQKLIPDIQPDKIAEPMVLELIRSGHFTNDKILQTKIGQVEKVLRKYLFILKNNPLYDSIKIKEKINLYNWLLEIAACEIEEILDPPLKESLLINFMTETVLEKIKIDPNTNLIEEEKKLQAYIAVHRTLFHLDAPLITYRLLKYRYFSEWEDIKEEALENITKNIVAIWEKIEGDLNHPLSGQFQKICERYDTIYLILGDILEKLSVEPESIAAKISHQETFEKMVKEAYDKRLSTLKSKLTRAAIYSTLSIFVAGGLSLFIVEVPLAKLFYGKFSPMAILVDILIPTLIMFILVVIIKPPGEDNFKKVVEEMNKLAYPHEEKDIYEIKVRKKKSWLMNLLIGVIYIVTNIASIMFVFWIFRFAKVPLTSLYIDTLNVAMVVFAALIIRQRAKEMTVTEKTSISQFVLDILSIPVAKLGQWLSAKWKEWNIVSVFFTALIDIPFLTLTEFVENWSAFLKEKKAEIR